MVLLRAALIFVVAHFTQPDAPQHVVFGHWHVTKATCPSKCALTRRQSDSWRGRSASYDELAARFGRAKCERPYYRVSYWPASGVYGGARLIDFGIRADSAQVVDIECPSQRHPPSDPRWQVPGGFLIVKDSNHVITIWEGVFFEMTRSAS